MQGPGGNSAPGSSLWRDGPFVRYFGSSLTWSIGEQVGLLALPLTAVLTLHVGAAQLGALAAAGRLPFLLIGLPVGVWIDRWRKNRSCSPPARSISGRCSRFRSRPPATD